MVDLENICPSCYHWPGKEQLKMEIDCFFFFCSSEIVDDNEVFLISFEITSTMKRTATWRFVVESYTKLLSVKCQHSTSDVLFFFNQRKGFCKKYELHFYGCMAKEKICRYRVIVF